MLPVFRSPKEPAVLGTNEVPDTPSSSANSKGLDPLKRLFASGSSESDIYPTHSAKRTPVHKLSDVLPTWTQVRTDLLVL